MTATGLDIYRDACRWIGQPYVFGAEERDPAPATPGPSDCSELVETAHRDKGVFIPDGAQNQYQWLKDRKAMIPVSAARGIVGAIGFRINFSGGDHVVFSDGRGGTMEARGRAYGCGTFSWDGRFNFAGLHPSIDYSVHIPAPKPPPPPFPIRSILAGGSQGSAVGALQDEIKAINPGVNLGGEDAQKIYGPYTGFAVGQAAHWFAVVNGLHQFDGYNGNVGVDVALWGAIDLTYYHKTGLPPVAA